MEENNYNISTMNTTNFCGECKNTTAAAKNGHLECLVYAHENGCRWFDISYLINVLNQL